MRLVISTDSAFFRHYARVRRWYGFNAEPARRGGLCKPCQAMFWGTLLAAAMSPLLLVGWAADRLQDWLNIDWIPRESLPDAPLTSTATRGVAALGLGSGAVVVCGIAVFLIGLVFVGAWNIADVAAAIRGAALCGGWYLFAGFAAAGGALLLAGGWAAQHYVAALACAAACFAAGPVIGAVGDIVGFLARPLSRRLAARREAREPLRTWRCKRCGCRNYAVWDRCDCGEGRPVDAARRLWRRAVGRTVGGKARVAGGLGIVWIWLKALAKGTCPLVEFLSPDELRACPEGRTRPEFARPSPGRAKGKI